MSAANARYHDTAAKVGEKLSELHASLNEQEQRVLVSILTAAGSPDAKIASPVTVKTDSGTLSLVAQVAYW